MRAQDHPQVKPSNKPIQELARPHAVHIVTAAVTTRLMRQQLRFLREAGFDVTIVSSPGPELDWTAEQEGVAQASLPMTREMSPWADLRSLLAMWRLIRRLRPTLVNIGTAKAGLVGGLASWAAGVPGRVYTLHGLRLETLRGGKRRVMILAERLICRCVQRVICVSESVRQRAIELRLAPADRLVVLGAGSFNGVDPERFTPTPERQAEARRLRDELGIPADAPVIGFLGRFTRDKGIAELTQAFQALRLRHPEARLLLLGRFEEGDPVPQAARSFIETDPGVVQAGFVADPSAYYHVLDILALPTYREGYPTVVLEASAAAKPVVGTYATGSVDAVVDGVTGLLVPVGDSEALAAALLRLIEDPDLAHQLGLAGRERVLRDYTTEQVCGRLAALYQELLCEAGVPEGADRG